MAISELADKSRCRQQAMLTAQINCRIVQAKSHKLLKRAPVIHMEFKSLIAKVVMFLENEHLEKDQRINPLGPCSALQLISVALIKQWAE